MLWSALAFLVPHSYSGNLRAHMIAVEYEKPLTTLADVVANGKRPWIPVESYRLRCMTQHCTVTYIALVQFKSSS